MRGDERLAIPAAPRDRHPSGPGSPAPVRASPLPDGGLSADDIAAPLTAAGLNVVRKTDDDGDPLLQSEVGGVKFSIYFYECTKGGTNGGTGGAGARCKSVQYSSGFELKNITQDKLGVWNRTKRFGRASLDEGGTPRVEMDIEAAAGMTTEALAENLRRWKVVLLEFAKYVGWK